jgi:phage tail-like protein
MTQARPRQTLAVQFTSMRPPDAIPGNTNTLSFATKDISDVTALVLYPGVASEMVIQLENTGDRRFNWDLDRKGGLPTDCQVWQRQSGDTTTTELLPRQKITYSLFFRVPINFFENQFALSQEQSVLSLDYTLQFYIYIEELSDRRRIEDTGDRQLVALHTVKLHVRPAGTYINFLPAIFRKADFTDRFLSIFEKTFAPTLQTLDLLWAYLDPLTAPEALLPFLAKWVGWEIDDYQSLEQQRRLIRNAVTLYRWHGTKWGLKFYLHLYTGLPLDEELSEAEQHISILETATDNFVLGSVPLGETAALGGGRPYHFTVRIRLDHSHVIDENLVRRVIERYKPAFCTYNLEIHHSTVQTIS